MLLSFESLADYFFNLDLQIDLKSGRGTLHSWPGISTTFSGNLNQLTSLINL